jgi:hypothetical protein
MNVKEIYNYMKLAESEQLIGFERLKTLNFKCLIGFVKEAAELNLKVNLLMANPYLVPAVILYLVAINADKSEESKKTYVKQLYYNCKSMVKYNFPWFNYNRYVMLYKVKKLCEEI